jgi:hypothetical protein
MRKLLILLFVGLSILANAQETALYNKNGALKIKPQYSVDSTRLEDIRHIEEYYLPYFFDHLNYPKKFFDLGVIWSSLVKIKINFANKTVIGEIVASRFPPGDSVVMQAFENSKNVLLSDECLKNKKDLIFYIPVRFDFEDNSDFQQRLSKEREIIIKAIGPAGCGILYAPSKPQ